MKQIHEIKLIAQDYNRGEIILRFYPEREEYKDKEFDNLVEIIKRNLFKKDD